MYILRLNQSTVSPDRFRVEAILEGNGSHRQTAIVEFDFPVTSQDREDLRWYLEDYLQYIADPAPKIAARIEDRIAQLGVELFKALFQSEDGAHDLWATLRDRLSDTRVEIRSGAHEATSLPWELLRDPKTDKPLALCVRSFVRAAQQGAQRLHPFQVSTEPIRILLVICRPGGSDDVPFRSVASRLLKGLGESAPEAFQLDVLRPPTFGQLSEVLRGAKKMGKPYHIVHFDGHGTYEDVHAKYSTQSSKNGRGYLVFENPAHQKRAELVHGTLLGRLLAETEVLVLVLNACRSAYAEAPATPATVLEQTSPHSAVSTSEPNQNAYAQLRAFGSLAQEVVDEGVAGVVAMRYNVYVVTACQFIAEVYESLASGHALGEAVSFGRKQLEAQPLREIAYHPRPLQDWVVPIVYEAAPIALFPNPAHGANLKITVSAHAATPVSGGLARELGKQPDAGFFGRDETLFALDRTFDTQAIILLHAYAGSGKTSTAFEFARWYHLTGGIDGPVLFTSFEHKKTLEQALNETIGHVFASTLEQAGIKWLSLPVEKRRDVALQLLAQIPVLWIWDNVEPITGFPAGTKSAWSDAEQQALIEFLSAARQTKAKFLLTSRRDERAWLGNLPARILMPKMPMQERVLLARALAKKHGRHMVDLENWMSLLRFTEGNPLTITIIVGQALRDGLKTKTQIETLVSRLQAGEAVYEDAPGEGRDKALGVSLSYGFEHAFTEVEQKQVALLHFFAGIVQASMLGSLGQPDVSWSLPEIRGLTRSQRIALLDSCSELGLLTPLGRGVYSIHPVVPSYLTSLFKKHYSHCTARATRAFSEAVGVFASLVTDGYEDGNLDLMNFIKLHYYNLLRARQIAITNELWVPLVRCMRALRIYFSENSWAAESEWGQLVAEIVPHFVDPASDGPIQGRTEGWKFLTQFRVEIASYEGSQEEAARLQTLLVDFSRRNIQNVDSDGDDKSRNAIRNFAYDLYVQAMIDLSDEKCIENLEEALILYERAADSIGGCRCAEGLCLANLKLNKFGEAEKWCNYAIRHVDSKNSGVVGGLLTLLGQIHYEHFQFLASIQGGSEEFQKTKWDRARSCLPEARKSLKTALNLLPQFRVALRAKAHRLLGSVFSHLDENEQAFTHLSEAIKCNEEVGQIESAMGARIELAVLLLNSNRFADARQYAYTALQYASRNADWKYSEQDLRQILDIIEERAKGDSNNETQ
ncbi:MAG: CHAT domain-containing protein [Proteobacteria bacterium]|nr:CHAT domain-containing protein [Pseudomonadota bacterium]MBU0967809.1 CHAT domain-containing protein [Pseudomonadota bacterium]